MKRQCRRLNRVNNLKLTYLTVVFLHRENWRRQKPFKKRKTLFQKEVPPIFWVTIQMNCQSFEKKTW